MKSESLREVRNNLSKVIDALGDSGPVLITKSGKTRAMLIPVDETSDLESLLLSVNPRFWELFDKAGESRAWTALEDL